VLRDPLFFEGRRETEKPLQASKKRRKTRPLPTQRGRKDQKSCKITHVLKKNVINREGEARKEPKAPTGGEGTEGSARCVGNGVVPKNKKTQGKKQKKTWKVKTPTGSQRALEHKLDKIRRRGIPFPEGGGDHPWEKRKY